MTIQDIEILKREDTREVIRQNIGSDPASVALKLKEHGALISSQIKYLRRARTKLPSYYAASCIIPPLAYEQSSSEQTASVKKYSGGLCIDLTCGLGVDSFYLAKNFSKVISIEKSEALAETARYNFSLLGADNIEVLNITAEDFLHGDFLKASPHSRAYLIYVDPARRDGSNKKLIVLEELSPDVTALLPRIKELTDKLVIKASPLFDTEEAFRIFAPSGEVTVEVVSAQGECKEVLIDIDFKGTAGNGFIKTTAAGGQSLTFSRGRQKRTNPLTNGNTFSPSCRYLLIPDVSLYKARVAQEYTESFGGRMFSATGFGFGQTIPPDFMGTVFEISEILPFQPKHLKKLLKENNIHGITILKKDFPLQPETIVKQLGVKFGEDARIAFTGINKKLFAILLKKQ